MSYTRLVKYEGRAALTFYHEGQSHVVGDDHPRWNEILEAAYDNEDYALAAELVDLKAGVTREFDRVSDRVSISGGTVYFDNVAVHGELVDQIVTHYEQGEDFAPLVNFMEKLYVNSNADSIDHLFRWISDRDLTITADGDFVAYKGVVKNDAGQFVSKKSGHAIVDGVEVNGFVVNNVGSVIEMPRNEVTFDPDTHCAPGLHAGTWDYASMWGSYVLTVAINPRDVVSVPNDHASQKLRVTRYRVTGITEGPLAQRVVDTWDTDFYACDDDYEEDTVEETVIDSGSNCFIGLRGCNCKNA